MAGIVFGNGRLKLMFEVRFLLAENHRDARKHNKKREDKPNSPQLDAHSFVCYHADKPVELRF